MPYKDKEKQRAAQAMWFQKNKVDIVNKTRLRRSKNREYVRDYKTKNSICADCGISYPHYVLDFDHVRGEKLFNIGMQQSQYSLDAIKEEIAKCEIVCSNCHRHRTWWRLCGDTGSPGD